MRVSIFILTVSQFLVAFIIAMALGWSQPDVRVRWPLALGYWMLLSAGYAFVFALLVPGAALQRFRIVAAWNGLIVTALVSYASLYYGLSIDWRGVNEGTVRLTLLQRIVRSYATLYGILVMGLIGPALIRIAELAGQCRR